MKEVTATGGWVPMCRDRLEQRVVPAITLAQALALAGSQNKRPIRLLKIDAQGLDIELVRSTPASEFLYVQAISVELHKSTPYCRDQGLYKTGRELCPEAVAYMASIGFKYVGYPNYVINPDWRLKRTGRQYYMNLVSPSACPSDPANSTSMRVARFCELQALFINERGALPPLDPYVLPILDPKCDRCPPRP